MEALLEIKASLFDDIRVEQGRKKMKQATENGADVNKFIHINKDITWLPLTYAVVNADLKTRNLLIECKADVNGEDGLGSTPLMMAILFLRPDKVKLLLGHNAVLTKKNSKGETAWHCIEVKKILFPGQEERRKKIVNLIRSKD